MHLSLWYLTTFKALKYMMNCDIYWIKISNELCYRTWSILSSSWYFNGANILQCTSASQPQKLSFVLLSPISQKYVGFPPLSPSPVTHTTANNHVGFTSLSFITLKCGFSFAHPKTKKYEGFPFTFQKPHIMCNNNGIV